MRDYEIVYIFRSNFTPEEIEAKLERYHEVLTRDGGGEITAVEQWGKRQLAYPIKKEPNGNYVVAQFTADPATLPELERLMKLDDDLLRFLIVLSEGELPIPPALQEQLATAAEREARAAERARARSGEAEDDEGDEDEEDEDDDGDDDEDEDEDEDEDDDEDEDEDEDEDDDEDDDEDEIDDEDQD